MKTVLKICSLLFVAIPISCSQSNSSNVKPTSNIYDIVSEQNIFLADCLSQSEKHYLVYFYSDSCSSCLNMKDVVVSFANSNIVKTYFVDTQRQENKIQICPIDELKVWVDDVNDLYIAGTPTIIEVKSGITVSNVAGESECLNFLETFSEDSNLD